MNPYLIKGYSYEAVGEHGEVILKTAARDDDDARQIVRFCLVLAGANREIASWRTGGQRIRMSGV